MKFLGVVLGGWWLAFLLLGCQTEVELQQTQLPPGNLGKHINSAADEINPAIPPRTPLLYFTTDRQGQQDLWVARQAGNTFDSARPNRTILSRLLSLALTNDGSIAFLTDTSGIFATGHPLDELYANRSGSPVGGLVGGTDLFSFMLHADSSYEIRNLRILNSFYWDAHPAVAHWNDTLLLIFSSDRPAPTGSDGNPIGFSVPFRNQQSVVRNDTISGNADLYFAFFVNGKWTPPQNLNAAFGKKINTVANEYSPFLFCVPRSPKLYFASDRNTGKLNLYRATLQINFGQQMIVVKSIEMLPQDSAGINTADANEMFPFIPFPHLNQRQYEIYLASDRDDTTRHWDTARYALRKRGSFTIKNVGKFDLYRFPLQEECRPPQLFYTVVLRNALNPSEPVLQPIIEIVVNGKRTRYHTDSLFLRLRCGDHIAAFGGSLYDSVQCIPAPQALSHYTWQKVTPVDTMVIERQKKIQQQVVANKKDAFTTIIDTTVFAIPINQFGKIRTQANEKILGVQLYGDSLKVTMAITRRKLDSSKAKFKTVTTTLRWKDTLIVWDTTTVAAYREFAPSVLTARNTFPPCNPHFAYQEDVLIFDTIWVTPAYISYPPCVREFTKDEHFIRNVPYFQTAFWEVNTPRNLERHLALFRTAAFRDAGFIELHRKNQYWGPEHPIRAGRPAAEQLWEKRVWQYRCYARIVEKNLRIMQKAINDTLLPAYEQLLRKLYGDPYQAVPEEKLIIQVTAFSDPRPIRRGWYVGDTVRYFAAAFDSSTHQVRFAGARPVIIRPKASLVGTDNDTLSKLRAYYGYQELLYRLRQSPLFQRFEAAGKVLLPTDVQSPEDFYRKAADRSIWILVEGRYVDTTEQAEIYGYRNTALLSQCDPKAIRSKDFFEYDDVRRIDITIHRIRFRHREMRPSPCGCGE